jgi:hypothetical protein
MKRYIFGIIFTVFLTTPHATAQIPPPIDLGIQNIPQETPVWCWVAVAQQIIHKINGPLGTPQQCQLVGVAFNKGAQYCCQTPTPCMTTGTLEQIQGLIAYFGGHWSWLSPPANPIAIYQTLSSGHAIIMAVQSSPYSGHVVVIRGMAWIPTPMGVQPVLYINDPMAYFTQPVPFASIAQYWNAAIIVN